MKRIVVLGSSGMAGHMVYHYLNSMKDKYDVLGISRVEEPGIKSETFDVEDDLYEFVEFLTEYKPNVIINCIGLLVQPSQDDPTKAIFLNSFLPHLLEDMGASLNCKIVHISTDCIFDGTKGPYTEQDWPTEKNWYGRSKALGEIVNNKDLTLRTSIIGPELKDNGTGLFEWFMRQTGEVNGYINVLWNGITTLELAKQIDKILDTNLSGLYHLTPDTSVSKGDLLLLIQKVWRKEDVTITPCYHSEAKNKILLNNRKEEYNPAIPTYVDQLNALRQWQDLGASKEV